MNAPSKDEMKTLRQQVVAFALKLTKSQREVIDHMTGVPEEAPHCGWHRRQGFVAKNICALGLGNRVPATSSAKPDLYHLNALGLFVRDWLRTGELPA